MGGKKKQQAQRTKNCVKPASSGRTTELLDSNFGNYNSYAKPALTAQFPSFPSLSLDLLDPQIDPNFLVALKKMSKKDGITRYKALSEFVNLCKESDDAAIKSALPSWTRFYCNLALDVENRIREATQHAHNAIVSKVGRNLAPFIKQIAPSWFVSQYDTYAPAASAATNSFQAAFPPHRLLDVIVFSQVEILQFISFNIQIQSPENILTNEKISKDDVEGKYERILISSLHGYGLYLSKVTKEHLEKVNDLNTSIVTSSKFWKLANHKSGAVRAAWFSLLSSMLQFAPHLIENEHKRVANTVLGRIDDYDPVVLPNVWEAALLIVSGIKDCWQYISMDKLFMPKFSHILSQGGQGNASFIYPNIILLLSNIPETVVKDKITFFGKIFSSFQKGLKVPCVTQSLSESEAVATSFIECVQYLIMVYTDDTDFCKSLIEQHVLQVLNTIMLETIHQHLMIPLYNSLAQLLIHWKNSESSNIHFREYTEILWQQLISNCKSNINKYLLDKNAIAFIFDSNIKMCECLNKRKCKRKKNLKVKFSTNDGECADSTISRIDESCGEQEESQIQKDLIICAGELSREYFNIATQIESYEIRMLAINQLWKLNSIFKKQHILEIIKGYEHDLNNGFYNWIRDEKIITESLIGVIFATVDNMQNEELKNGILLELTKVRSKDAILQAAKLAVNYSNEALSKWLKSDLVKDELCSLYKTLEENDVSVDVLQHCLKSDSTGEFIVGDETVLALISFATDQLKHGAPSNSKHLCMILDSFSNNNNPKCLHNYKDLLFQLMYLCFRSIISDESRDPLYIAWQKQLNIMAQVFEPNDSLFIEHITSCANFVATFICENNITNERNLSSIIKVCYNFISAIVRNDPIKMANIGMDLSKKFLNSVLDKSVNIYQPTIEDMCFQTEFISGSLFCTDLDTKENSMVVIKEKWDPLKDINLCPYVRSLLYCTQYILYLLDNCQDADNAESDNSSEQSCKIPSFEISKMNFLIPMCLQLCHGQTLAQSFKSHFNDTKQYFIIKNNFNSFSTLLKELIHRLDPDQQKNLCASAEQNATKLGGIWNQVASLIAKDILDLDTQLQFKSLTSDLTLCDNSNINVKYIRALRNDMVYKFVEDLNLLEILDNLVITYKSQPDNFKSKDLTNSNSNDFLLDSEIARLLTLFIDKYDSILDESKSGWDFIMICIASWMQNISTMKSSPKFYTQYVGFVSATCDLYSHFICYLVKHKLNTKLFEEWQDVFLNDVRNFVKLAWENVAQKTVHNNLNYVGYIHLKKLCNCICIICQHEEMRYLQITSSNYEIWLNVGKKFITSPCVAVQLTAYYILITVVPTLVKLDSTCDENDLGKLTCKHITDQFIETQNVVTTMLQDFNLGVSCSVAPFTDSYTYTLGFILIWSVLLEMCRYGDSQIRYIYTLWIKEMNLIAHVMESLLKLMPESVVHSESGVKKRQELFTEKPPFAFDGWVSERLSRLCCWLFCDLLRTLPAVARQWSAETDPKLLSVADKITTTYVSPALCNEEMKATMDQQKGFHNMKVTTHPSVREVVAVYTVEESTSELIITLASNHPLTPPKVEIPKAMISSNQTRQWLMQLTIFLTHQNGSIWDGLLLWKSNLDKKFEGIEECYICFSILHNASHQLPKLSCQTCKKKFHSFCLYKWFTTSNKSTCPICRNHF